MFCTFFAFLVAFGSAPPTVFGQCDSIAFETLSRKAVAPFSLDRVIVADFSGDNKPDIAIHDAENGKLTTYLNDGTGNFGNPIINEIGAQSSVVLPGDLNNDGKKDLVISYQNNSLTVRTFLGDNTGNFALWNQTTLPLHPGSALRVRDIANFNNDNRPDFVVDNMFFALNSDGTYATSGIQLSNSFPVIGDFNADGKADFAVSSLTTGARTSIFINNGTGSSFAETTLENQFYDLELSADINNDGKSDLVAFLSTNVGVNKTIVFLSNSAGGFTRTETALPNRTENYTFFTVRIGDFNGDGLKDLLIPSASSTFSLNTILLGSANGAFTAFEFLKRLPNSPSSNVFADFDGDGKTDHLSFARGTFFPFVFLLVKKNNCAPAGKTKIVDFDGDSATDVALWRASDGRWTIENSNGAVVRRVFWGRGDLGDVPTPGDYDGDGRTDIAVWRASEGVWYVLRSSDNSIQSIYWGMDGDKPVHADYDGDGKTDAAVYRASNGVWYVRQSSDATLFTLQFGLPDDKPVPADYDGDNKADIVVWRPSNGVWYHLNSNANYGFSAVRWGRDGDQPAPTDYDGDGKVDVAVWRPSDSVWYLRSSYNQSFAAYRYGSNGDSAQPGNYAIFGNCCNETALLGVYRPTNNAWYLNISSFTRTVNLGENGEVPVSKLPRVE
ncbi:MAG: Multicopper oxidase [uncultured Pyrinomonadaceae bacterium]|uniref:Multicopper oxidase n=1 Tax=uncultured Pyrinomonadaceae bacterium TaxID=2283094 RepID=A0A6J4PY86_9BACT|nr:MAG: Multicopper oxidase [uncultured Pyrinomonadaceae bacterium]